MYIPVYTLASILSLQYLFFYRAQLKCVDSFNTQTYVSVIKEGYCIICYYYKLYKSFCVYYIFKLYRNSQIFHLLFVLQFFFTILLAYGKSCFICLFVYCSGFRSNWNICTLNRKKSVHPNLKTPHKFAEVIFLLFTTNTEISCESFKNFQEYLV